MISVKDKAHLAGLMVDNTLDNGRLVNSTVKEPILALKVIKSQDFGRTEKK